MDYLLISSQLPSPLAAGGTNQRTRLLLDALIECGQTSFWFLEVHSQESRSKKDKERLVEQLSTGLDVEEVEIFENPKPKGSYAKFEKWVRLVSLVGCGSATNLVKVLGYRVNHAIRDQILERVARGDVKVIVFRYVEAAIVCGLFDGLLGEN